MIPNEKIDEIISKTDIVELVLNEGISLERVGRNYRGLCPFHDDSNPSFYVNNEKKLAYCMTCKGGGNPITFIRQKRNLSYEEACLYVANLQNIPLDINIAPKQVSKYQKHYKIMQNAQEFYEYYLNNTVNGEKALEYLHKRRLSDETIKSFHIGLSPSKTDILYKTLSANEESNIEMLETGLIKTRDNTYYDMFINRIMFPIDDDKGQTVAFSGRVFDTKSDSKYVNSPETVIFHKGDILYNLYNIRDVIKKKNRIILFEGFMDVIAASNAGIKEGVCSMGTALTPNQARLMKKYTDKVIICYDGDNAGIEATKKAITILHGAKLNIGIVMLPEGLDPDEYASKYGNDALLKYFDNVLDVYGFYYNYLKKSVSFNNFSEVDNFKYKVFDMIYKTRSETLVENYLNQLSEDIKISVDAIKIDYINYFKLSNTKKTVETNLSLKNKNAKIDNKYVKAEKTLLRYMMNNIQEAYQIESKIQSVLGDFGIDPIALDMRIKLIHSYYDNNELFDIDSFISLLSDETEIKYVYSIYNILISNTEEEINDMIKILSYYDDYIEIDALQKKISETNLDQEKALYASKIVEIKNKQRW